MRCDATYMFQLAGPVQRTGGGGGEAVAILGVLGRGGW